MDRHDRQSRIDRTIGARYEPFVAKTSADLDK